MPINARFPFQIVPPQQEEEDGPPQERPDFIPPFAPPRAPQAQEDSFARRVGRTGSALARTLIESVPEEERGVPTAGEPGEKLSLIENASRGIREGWQMSLVGAGTLAELATNEDLLNFVTTGAGAASLPLQLFRNADLRETVQNYGESLRRNAGEEYARLAEAEPEGFVQSAVRESARMLPLVASTAIAGFAGGIPGAMAAAGLVSYPTEKGFLKTTLEDEGLSPEEAELWSGAGAVPIAAAESAFEIGLAGRLANKVTGEVVGEGLKRTFARRLADVAKHIGKGSTVEGTTEALQEAIGIGVETAATGQMPEMGEIIERLTSSAIAGAYGGGVYGGAFGFVGDKVQEKRQIRNQRAADAVRAAAVNFDPKAVKPGETVAGKTKGVDSEGREYWQDESGTRTTAPTEQEVEVHLLGAENAAVLAEEGVVATEPQEPVDVPVSSAVQHIIRTTGKEVEPSVVELNVRAIAADYGRQARRKVLNRNNEELQSEKAALESIALDESSDVDYATRVTALARKRAIEHAQTVTAADNIGQLDFTSAARSLQELDEVTFAAVSAQLEASGKETDARTVAEARALRQADAQLADAANAPLNKILDADTARRSRGLKPDNKIATKDGRSGTVIAERSSGYVEVKFDDGEVAVVDPSDVEIRPNPGEQVQLTGGQVVTIKETNETGITAELEDGGTVSIKPNEIERVGVLEEDAPSAQEETGFVDLPEPLALVDSRTGEDIEVVAVAENEVKLADGTIVPYAEVGLSDSPHIISEIAETGEIPVFQAGTRPEKGRHINFLQLNEREAAIFEELVKGGNLPTSFLANRLTLLPQPSLPGTRTFAVEVPAKLRSLSTNAKRVLGFLTGKSKTVPKTTLGARVGVGGLIDTDVDQVGVYQVPPALMVAVRDLDAASKMSTDERREYVRRLADLNFSNISAPVAEQMQVIQTKATEAANARIDGDIGKAERLEVEVPGEVAELALRLTEEEIAARDTIWKELEQELINEMTPEDIDAVQAFNSSTAEELQTLTGIGPKIAERIIQQRADQGGSFGTIADLIKVKGLDAVSVSRITREAREKGLAQTNVSNVRAERFRKLLADWPGRRGDVHGTRIAFRHPTIPDLVLTIDKETIPSARPTERTAIPEETLGDLYNTLDPEDFQEVLDEASGVELGERDIYHIKFLQGTKEIHARTIGSETNESVKVPAHLAIGRDVDVRGFSSTPPAVRRITEGIREGRTIDEIVSEMEDERRDAEYVTLEGRTQAMVQDRNGVYRPVTEMTDAEIEEAGGEIITMDEEYRVVQQQTTRTNELGETVDIPMVVEDQQGNRFEVDPEDIAGTPRRKEEPMVPIKSPRRLSSDEVLSEVVREISSFGTKGRMMGVGQYVGDKAGLYAMTHPVPDGGVSVWMYEESQSRAQRANRLFDPTVRHTFPDEATASAWLRERGFEQSEEWRVVEGFKDLPDLESISDSNALEAHTKLTRILDIYASHGFFPQPVRDYAVGFARRWGELNVRHPAGLFGKMIANSPLNGREIRRVLGVKDPHDTMLAAQRISDDALIRELGPDLTIEDGRVVRDAFSPSESANDVRVMRGTLVDNHRVTASRSQIAAIRSFWDQFAHRERFLDAVDGDLGLSAAGIADRLVEVEGRLGVIVDSEPGANSMTVQFMDENGQTFVNKVGKQNIDRVRSPDKALDYFRTYKDSLGEITNLPKTPEMGLSPLDKRLGLGGVRNRDKYISTIGSRIETALKYAGIAEDGSLNGRTKYIRRLRDAFIRMKELGISNRDLPENQRIPPVLLGRENDGLLVDLAYDEIRNTYSNISPYGDLIAKAKMGLLPIRQRQQIEKKAKEFGFTEDAPVWRKAEFLVQNVLDPHTAHMLYQMKREFAINKFATGIVLPEHGVEIRMPAGAASVRFSKFLMPFTFPRTVADRHPTMRVFHVLAEKERTAHGNRVKRGMQIIKGLQGWRSGMNLQRKTVIWDLLQDPELGEAQTGPADILTKQQVEAVLGKENLPQDWDWYKQYGALRNLIVEARTEHISNALIRGFALEAIDFSKHKVDPNNTDRREKLLKQTYGLSKDERNAVASQVEAGGQAYNLERISNPAFARPRDEVDFFVDLINNYKAFEEIPAEVREEMAKSKKLSNREVPWMIDEFDFWVRFGINNYAPKLLQGRHVIKRVTADGDDDIVAFAPDGVTAEEFIFRAARGDVNGVEVGDELYFEYRRAIADDLDMQFLGPKRFAKFYSQMAKEYGGRDGKGAQLARAAAKALRVGSKRALPRDIHMESRIADLSDIIEDPYERMLLYWARTSRNNFLLGVENAFETAKAADARLSQASGMDAIFDDEAFGEMGHKPLRDYMQNLRDSFMGRPTSFDQWVGSAINFLSLPSKFSRITWEQLKRRIGDEDYSLWTDPIFLDAFYNEDYASRRWAENFTTIQSVWRLGLNIGGAAVNSTQHIMFTPAWLISQGVPVAKAYQYSTIAQTKDIYDYMKERGNGELSAFVEQAGTVEVPARGVAGPGLGIVGRRAPLFFAEDNWMDRFTKLVNYSAMRPFSWAESSVRLASTFAAKRAAEDMGLSHDAAVAFARKTVDNTQFQYYDQALPPFMRGPGARVLFQFQQFPLNALKFEKDLILGLKDPAKRKAWLAYNAGGLMMGGLAWEASRPFFAFISSLLRLGNLEEHLMNALGGHEDRTDEMMGPNVGDPEFLSMMNAILYGLPGLADLQLSARLGVSGLELDPTNAVDLTIGPTGSMYKDLYDLMLGQGGMLKTDPGSAALFGGVGAAISSRTGLPVPMATLLTQQLTNAAGMERINQHFGTENGRRFLSSMSPTLVRGITHTVDIFEDNTHETSDIGFNARFYRGQLNGVFESLTKMAGLQTIRNAEERAYVQYMLKDAEEKAELRRSFAQEAASIVERGGGRVDIPAVREIIARSKRMEAGIDMDDIRRELENRQHGAEYNANERSRTLDRMYGGNRP